MGVPALFRFLQRKYPRIIDRVAEEQPTKCIGNDALEVEHGVDIRGPNPNGEEFDHLYLDFNGIVHPCCHPEGRQAPETEDEMMVEIFKYTERVVNMVRPRKLLFMAIDGVAPRAKMNQQRSRRFRSAMDAKIKQEETENAIADWEAQGRKVPEEWRSRKKEWDSNVITPGTPFMDLLASSLRYWVAKKINTDPGWKSLKVLISDASVPGEGEHKIMSFIRSQRQQPGYNANTKHVIYGLDADLIMLSLATHEPHFRVLREDVFWQEKSSSGCHRCGQPGHHSATCTGQPKTKIGEFAEKGQGEIRPFIWLDVAVLREYLAIELEAHTQNFPFDLERAIDDWIFLIFFVGNDFLPHLPSLEIREGAVDTLLSIWKESLIYMPDYVTDSGKINLSSVIFILQGLSDREDDIFKRRKQSEERADRAQQRRKLDSQAATEARNTDRTATSGHLGSSAGGNGTEVSRGEYGRQEARVANMTAAELLRAELVGKSPNNNGKAGNEDFSTSDKATTPMQIAGTKRKLDSENSATEVARIDLDEDAGHASSDDSEAAATPPPKLESILPIKDNVVIEEDNVRLWESGYRERYYRLKFGVELSDIAFRRQLVYSYIEGLSWVLCYYFQGCPSWNWFYPYHYAPFAQDFKELGIETFEISFELGKPFRPFEQLMGVFPSASRHAIPEAYHHLMVDEESEIADFYPETFPIDMNGKKMAWQGVSLLPFIDQKRLQHALRKHEHKLTADQVARNTTGNDTIFVGEENALYDQLCKLYTKSSRAKAIEMVKSGTSVDSLKVPMDVHKSEGISGFVSIDLTCVPGSTYPSPLAHLRLEDISADSSVSAHYFYPDPISAHQSILLAGARSARPRLSANDKDFVRSGGRLNNQFQNPSHRGYVNGPTGPGVGMGTSPHRHSYGTPRQNSYSYENSKESTTKSYNENRAASYQNTAAQYGYGVRPQTMAQQAFGYGTVSTASAYGQPPPPPQYHGHGLPDPYQGYVSAPGHYMPYSYGHGQANPGMNGIPPAVMTRHGGSTLSYGNGQTKRGRGR